MNKPEILIIINTNSMYFKGLRENLKKIYSDYIISFFSVETLEYRTDEEIIWRGSEEINVIQKIFLVQKVLKIMKSRNIKLININFVSPSLFLFNDIFEYIPTIATFWGSDLYRIPRNSGIYKRLQKSILKRCSYITSDNKDMEELIYKTYRCQDKPYLETKFGLPIDFELFKKISQEDIKEFKEKYSIPEKSIVITLSYSSDPKKNHEYMIDEVLKLKDNYDKLYVFIPMAYGNREHCLKIKNYCKKQFGGNNVKYCVIDKFIADEEVAKLRNTTDIMINVQTTDSMSSSMLESIYAGNIVINGAWLPYDNIAKEGIYFEKIDNILPGMLSNKIQEIIKDMSNYKVKCIKNPEIVYKLSSWENNIKNWKKAYDFCLKKQIG